MLTEEPSDKSRDDVPGRAGRLSRLSIALLVGVFVLVLALRHDYWNWDRPGYLLFGFVPVGLWWQALVSICASLMMWLMVRLAWPGELEREAIEGERQRLARQQRRPPDAPAPPSTSSPGSPR